MRSLPLAEAFANVAHGPAILADSGDNPTAGGVGDRADVLAYALSQNVSSALFAGIADPAAYIGLRDGARTVKIGGSLGGGGPRIELFVESCRFSQDCAVIQTSGLTVLISKRRRPFHNMSDFDELGLKLDEFHLLVVKSGYLSPDLRKLARHQVMALTEGAVSQNLRSLTNEHRLAGTWFAKGG
jgi:microcystin degradation protein MlrC